MVSMAAAHATGRAQPAFRIEQENARRHDSLAGSETRAYFHPVGELRSERDRARLEAIADGFVAVTPLHLDFTDEAILPQLAATLSVIN